MTTRKSRLSLGGLVLLFCGTFALAGFFMAPQQRAHATTSALVRIIHASPYIAAANIFVDGKQFLTSFGFGQVTDYGAVPPGPHTVLLSFTVKGTPETFTETLPVQPGGVYTVAAVGDTKADLSLQVFNDNNIAVAGSAKVRIYQLIPDGGWLDASAAGKSTGANYQHASSYLTFTPGTTAFSLTGSGGHSLSTSTTLQANTVTSIFAVGMFNGTPSAQLVTKQTAAVPGLPDTGSNPFVFLSDGYLSTPWLLIALAMVVVGGTFFTRRLFASH